MKKPLFIIATLACSLSQAQVYKCVVNGATTYQPNECAAGDSKKVNTDGAGKLGGERKPIFIGMSQDDFKEARGEPSKINRTISASGTSEQWIYGTDYDRKYYYFTNDKLTSVQLSR